jgi:preprotein translocase subunit YajC
MFGLSQETMTFAFAIFAQQEGQPAWASFMPMIIILFVMYFVMFLPMRRQKQQMALMLAAIKKGDKVLTSAGLIGTVVTIKENEDEMTLRSDETKIRVLKSTIIKVYADDADKPAEAKA